MQVFKLSWHQPPPRGGSKPPLLLGALRPLSLLDVNYLQSGWSNPDYSGITGITGIGVIPTWSNRPVRTNQKRPESWLTWLEGGCSNQPGGKGNGQSGGLKKAPF